MRADFPSNKSTLDSLAEWCIDCRKEVKHQHYICNKKDYIASVAKRRADILNRTPKWADLDKIKKIYLNCPEGHHVDHIIPLRGVNVSGLHVAENLQYLTAIENLSKGNKYVSA